MPCAPIMAQNDGGDAKTKDKRQAVYTILSLSLLAYIDCKLE